MRDDTKEVCDLLDTAANLVDQGRLEEAQRLLIEITKLINKWVERHLSP